MHRQLFFIAVLLLAAGAAWAQSPPTPDQTELMKALLDRVQQLEKRVAELEAKQGTSPNPSVYASNVAGAPKLLPQETAAPPAQVQAAVQQVETHYPSLQIRGFADMDFSATDQKGATSGFNLGQLDLLFSSPLSRKISYFGEMTFNAQPTGYNVDVERSFIRYDYNDYFKVSFGRYHTPIGYWNTAFHHGTWLQSTVELPEMLNEDAAFLPRHTVGFLAEGNIPSGGAGLAYSVGVGNGRGQIISRPGDAGDNNSNRAWVADIFARPVKLYGLQFGASVYRDKISLGGGNDFREWIASAHLVWTKGDPEFLAEFANVNHRSILTNKVANSDAFYVQLGYRMPGLEKKLKPYYRFEYIHTPKSEGVFPNLNLVESIVGLRYDISTYAAFKSEYRHASRQSLATPTFNGIVNGLFLQTSFTF